MMQSGEEAVATAAAPARPALARKEAKKKQQAPSIRYPFWFGGSASSLAACVTHPLDLGEPTSLSSHKVHDAV